MNANEREYLNHEAAKWAPRCQLFVIMTGLTGQTYGLTGHFEKCGGIAFLSHSCSFAFIPDWKACSLIP